MIIKLEDIPPEGRTVEFDLEPGTIAERLSADTNHKGAELKPIANPSAKFSLTASGKTVVVQGKAKGSFEGSCARCTERAIASLDIPVQMILKPLKDIEDVQLSSYDGREINLGPILEEQLLLSLPFVLYCSPNCKGLCPKCGTNLNNSSCDCKDEENSENKFQLLKGLKLS